MGGHKCSLRVEMSFCPDRHAGSDAGLAGLGALGLSAAALRVRSWAPHWGAAHADVSPAHVDTWWVCSPQQGLPWWALGALAVAVVWPQRCAHNLSDASSCTQCCLSPFQMTMMTARRDTRIGKASSGHGCCELALAGSTGFTPDNCCIDPI